MIDRTWRMFSLLIALVSLIATGCGKSSTLAEVEGTVKLRGQPLPSVQVEFIPDPANGTKGPRSVGITDESGHFQLVCDNQRDGAVAGRHLVVVRDTLLLGSKSKSGGGSAEDRREAREKPSGKKAARSSVSRVPMQYTSFVRTPLKQDVQAGTTNKVALELKP